MLLRCGADPHAVAATAAPSAPTPHSLATQLAARGQAADGSTADLVLSAARPWSPVTHELFPTAARARAATLLRLGYLLSARFPGHEAAWTELWRALVLPGALFRGASDRPDGHEWW